MGKTCGDTDHNTPQNAKSAKTAMTVITRKEIADQVATKISDHKDNFPTALQRQQLKCQITWPGNLNSTESLPSRRTW